MSVAKAKFDVLAHELQMTEQVRQKLTFGAPSLLANGYSFALFSHEAMGFRLMGESNEQALALSGAYLFAPTGQPMKNWVCLPVAQAETWRDWAFVALEQVRALPPKKPRSPKKSTG